jgi:hypothetical protein
MNGNIGKQQVEANTTLPSAARLARIVRPDLDAFALVLSVSIRLLLAAFSLRLFTLPARHDRTTCRVAMRFEFALTCREMPSERATKIFHSCHFAVQLAYLLIQQITHSAAFFSATRSQQSLDLVQRQTQLLRLLYEADSLNHFRSEETEASTATRRARQQSSAFVETDCVNRDCSALRQISDLCLIET